MKTTLNPFLAASITAVLALSSSAFAVDRIKANNTDNLNLATSWGGTAPSTGDVGVWDSTVTSANTVNLGANLSWAGLRIADPGGDVTIGGANSLTLGASGLDTGSTRNLTINATGSVNLSGPLAGSTTLTISSNTTKNWANTGAGMKSTSFTGTLVLRGGTGASGAYSGNWLAFGAATFTQTGAFALDTGASLTNRGEFIMTDAFGDGTSKGKLNLTSLTGYGDFRSDWGDTGNRTISVNQSTNTEFQGRIVQNNTTTRSIHLEKLGAGTLTLSGENSYQNTIVGGSGKLQIGNGGATGNIGSGTVSVGTGSTLEFNRTGTLDYKASAHMRTVSGAGDIVVNGGVKIWNYTGSGTGFAEANSWNNFTGNLTIKGGSEFQTIRNGATAMGTGKVILGDGSSSGKLSQIEGSWTWTNNIQLDGSANEIINNAGANGRWNKLQGVISGNGGITFKDSTGGMDNGDLGFILTSANTMSGTLTVDTFVRVGGVTGNSISLDGGTGGTLGTAEVVINSGKRLTFSRTDSHTVANSISGDGDVNIGSSGISGTGTQVVTFTGTKSYTGATNVNAGTLVISGNISTSTLTTVNTGGTLSGIGTLGAVTIASGGTLAPGSSLGTMTFTGDLTLSAGSISNFEITDFGFGNFDLAIAATTGSQSAKFNGGTLNLLFQSGFNTNGTVKIFEFDSYSGSGFTTVNTTGLADGFSATFSPTTGIVTVIPEPTAALLGGLGLLTLLRRRRLV